MKVTERTHSLHLRQRGFTYREILDHVSVSRSTLSIWLRDVTLTQAQKARIYGKSLETRRKFCEYNRKKRETALARHSAWREQAKRELKGVSPEMLKWVGVALYWGEGTKASGNKNLVSFANSDPNMIALMMRWFREICKVPEEKFRIRVQLHPGQSVEKAEAMWSRVTGVPRRKFTQPYVKTSPSSQRKAGNILPYGTGYIRIASTELFQRILGWIEALSAPSSSGPGRIVLNDKTGVRFP